MTLRSDTRALHARAGRGSGGRGGCTRRRAVRKVVKVSRLQDAQRCWVFWRVVACQGARAITVPRPGARVDVTQVLHGGPVGV